VAAEAALAGMHWEREQRKERGNGERKKDGATSRGVQQRLREADSVGKQEVASVLARASHAGALCSQRRRQSQIAKSPLALEGFPGKNKTAQVLV
jgi:hypothetical protein